MMNLIRKVHGLVERPDLTKHRQSQDRIGAILGTEKGIAYEETEVDGMSCEWVKVERAHLKRYVILYCHGGGYSTGSTVYARTLTTKLAESTGMDVFCFNYRLAPECKFPAAAEDAMKAWNYLMYLGYGARDVIVAGDSAGGNLALSLTLKLKEEGRMLPRGLALMSPWTDLTKSGKSYHNKKRCPACHAVAGGDSEIVVGFGCKSKMSKGFLKLRKNVLELCMESYNIYDKPKR